MLIKPLFRDILANEDLNLDNMFIASLVGDIIRFTTLSKVIDTIGNRLTFFKNQIFTSALFLSFDCNAPAYFNEVSKSKL